MDSFIIDTVKKSEGQQCSKPAENTMIHGFVVLHMPGETATWDLPHFSSTYIYLIDAAIYL
jgi:hypothetical protein